MQDEQTSTTKPRRKRNSTASAAPRARATRRREVEVELAPIDGFDRPDMVDNQRKGFKYAMLTAKDASRKRHIGYRRVEQGEGAPHPRFWSAEEHGSHPGHWQDGLTLYEIPEQRHAEIHRASIARADQRMATIGFEATHGKGGARVGGGEHSSRVST